jgi:hypothetical protein
MLNQVISILRAGLVSVEGCLGEGGERYLGNRDRSLALGEAGNTGEGGNTAEQLMH